MACPDETTNAAAPTTENTISDALVGGTEMTSPEKPRRNLTKDFALCMEKGGPEAAGVVPSKASSDAPTPPTAKADSSHPSNFSPTSVITDSGGDTSAIVEEKKEEVSYHFQLHGSLQRGLSQALVDRVSFYGIIHDVNKEAAAMAMNDPKQQTSGEEDDGRSSLVQAATGTNLSGEESSSSDFRAVAQPTALIDEEAWLLEIVGAREPEERLSTVCPPTFLQAMGEREYENPVQALSGATRTQLWKPSRSWWEAKSGKNPWIEPSSHNKRWRYLWPLIHYHKFLAKCIKKLKRNGVDVKHAVSPVAVFLREEVCAVSDHLAECSRFDSDEWMDCLKYFEGWTEVGGEGDLRTRIGELKLRPLQEPSDVDSKLLRDQVDRHFLASMAKARAQLREENETATTSENRSRSHPPTYPRSTGRSGVKGNWGHTHHGAYHARRPHYTTPTGMHEQYAVPMPPHHSPYWSWDQHSMVPPYSDSASVHSSQSNESGYVQPPSFPMYMHPMAHPGFHPPYYGAPMMYPHGTASHRVYSPGEDGSEHQAWVDPASYELHLYHPYQTPSHSGNETPLEFSEHEDLSEVDMPLPHPENTEGGEVKETTPPVKYQGTAHQQSPFWSHLDSVAVGLATPAKSSPETPRRTASQDTQEAEDAPGYLTTAQPLLLRGYTSYGHYGARDGYAPPSPSTLFTMSPQPNFAPTYGYPYRTSSRSPRKKSHQVTSNTIDVTPPPSVRKVVPATTDSLRESPTTVETTTDSDSLPGAST